MHFYESDHLPIVMCAYRKRDDIFFCFIPESWEKKFIYKMKIYSYSYKKKLGYAYENERDILNVIRQRGFIFWKYMAFDWYLEFLRKILAIDEIVKSWASELKITTLLLANLQGKKIFEPKVKHVWIFIMSFIWINTLYFFKSNGFYLIWGVKLKD